MKFNALVVAAMVITSVSAGLPDKLPSGVENSGGRSMSVFPQGTSGNGPGPLQESDHTNKEPADDSGGDGIDEDSASDEELDGHEGLGDASNKVVVKSNPVCDSLISELKTLWNRFMTINSDARSEAITLKGPSTKKKTFL
ncbi:hypothetical protein BASA81_017705, partial [Batrachochytrium salamandrivorans]